MTALDLESPQTQSENERILSQIYNELTRYHLSGEVVTMEQLVNVDERIGNVAKEITEKEGSVEQYKNRFVEFYHLLSFLFDEKNHAARAEENLARAFKLDKSNVETIFRMGLRYYDKGDYEISGKAFARLIKIGQLSQKAGKIEQLFGDKKRLVTLVHLGIHYFDQKDLDKAHGVLTNVTALAQIGLKESECSLSEVLDLSNAESEAWYYLGKIQMERNKRMEALKLLENSIQLNGNDKANALLGFLYFKLGKIDDALKCYQDSVKNNPNNREGLNGIFDIFEMENRALDDYLDVIDLDSDPDNSTKRFFVAEAYMKFAMKSKLSKFKDAQNTTVPYDILNKIVARLEKAETAFAASFQKDDPGIDKEFEEIIKSKIVEARSWLKILRDYRKEKTGIYWQKMNPDSVQSFELYFEWSEKLPADSSVRRYEEIRKTADKNPVPLLYIGKAQLREVIKSANSKKKTLEPTEMIKLLDEATKNFNKAKNMELENGPLIAPIQKQQELLKETRLNVEKLVKK
jgi:tetratricopeptide (TPR) repeat protein